MIRFIFLFLSASLLASSCAIHSKGDGFTPLSNQIPCERLPNEVTLFFKGENIDFSYQRIGIVQVRARTYNTPQDVLDMMKYKTRSHCANAVILLEGNFTTGRDGTINADVENDDNSLYYTGIAVFAEEIPYPDYDRSFILRSETTPKKSKETMYMGAGFISLIFLFLAIGS